AQIQVAIELPQDVRVADQYLHQVRQRQVRKPDSTLNHVSDGALWFHLQQQGRRIGQPTQYVVACQRAWSLHEGGRLSCSVGLGRCGVGRGRSGRRRTLALQDLLGQTLDLE